MIGAARNAFAITCFCPRFTRAEKSQAFGSHQPNPEAAPHNAH